MCTKIVFSMQEAQAILNGIKHNKEKYRREIRRYYCVFHNGWHLTSKELIEEAPFELSKEFKKKIKKYVLRRRQR